MEISQKALRLTASACLLALAACSGGGGGNSPATTTSNTGSTSSNTGSTSSGSSSGATLVSINAPDSPSTGGVNSPSFNFTTNLPPVGTTLSLPGSVLAITPTTVSGAGNGQGVTATFRGTVVSNGVTYPVFDLDIPVLSVHATNVRGDGTAVTLSDGSKVSAAAATLNYTLLGAWTYTPAGSGPSYIGQTVTGSLTPVGSIPSSGTATYNGTGSSGGVVGAFAVPASNGTVIQGGALTGDVSLTVNFASNTANGTLSNMTATTTANGSGATPWNNVTMTGTLSRSGGGSLSGTTGTSGPPAGAGNAGFSSAATGSFAASFYGPSAQEVGGTWTLHEGSGSTGKTAVGTFVGR